jgi:hypothetical protein
MHNRIRACAAALAIAICLALPAFAGAAPAFTLGIDAPCGWAAWDQLGRDPAIGPTLDVLKLARAHGVRMFFITGRPENQREATERNLKAADFKAPLRAQIEQQGYTIIANIGDQPSDLLGGHSQKDFLLPDPFYRVK